MRAALDKRLRRVRSQAARLRWQCRQRHHAAGSWFRLRRVLAEASAAWAIEQRDAEQLLREGHHAEPVGDELHPTKTLVFATAERIALIDTRRSLALHLDAELLAARWLVLERFPLTS